VTITPDRCDGFAMVAVLQSPYAGCIR